MLHPNVRAAQVDTALKASPELERRYLASGGSPGDLRTDLSHALNAVLGDALANVRMLNLTERREAHINFGGPERRRPTRAMH